MLAVNDHFEELPASWNSVTDALERSHNHSWRTILALTCLHHSRSMIFPLAGSECTMQLGGCATSERYLKLYHDCFLCLIRATLGIMPREA
jgi:hypothetical protein